MLKQKKLEISNFMQEVPTCSMLDNIGSNMLELFDRASTKRQIKTKLKVNENNK